MGDRHSIRLKSYDYSLAGFYFITICTKSKFCLFGEIENRQMMISDAGTMIKQQWEELPRRFNGVILDEFIVMPNHFHGIIQIQNATVGAPLVGAQNAGTKTRNATVGEIIGAYKSLSTNEYIQGVKELGWRPFDGKLLQRNFHEHIIRNKKSLNKIRKYIIENPFIWADDEENPNRNG